MFCIGICDDDEGLCGELEKMLYDYGKEHKIQMNIDIWYQGESLCRFLRENKKILDVLFLDIELLTTNGIEVGRFIREEQENMETAIVYISANSSYAMDLFRVQPTDFLIKPLDKIKVGNVMNRIQNVFCKPFLHKIAKYFCRLLHIHFVGNCKALADNYSASHIAIADHI